MNNSGTIDQANDHTNDIAIIGMACRLPGARNIDEFWQNVRDGVESISFFSDEELLSSGVDPSVITARNYVKAAAVLEDIGLFDAAFFGLTPREAEIMDPQHRIFLECAWQALEHAGYNPESYHGRIGIYAGVGMNTYLSLAQYNAVSAADLFQMAIGNEKEHLATHTAYKLNLKGPSVSVSTACSTSLVAVHMACQSLLSRECDMFLAGGVTVRSIQKVGYSYEAEGIASPDGHCRAFDRKALGTVPGNGAGVVILKRLDDALRDGDCIHAVIKGSAINNDGSLRVGYTAPGVQGQIEVIAEAQAVAGIEPEEIAYIETHGTGTPLGDTIEITALTKVFRARTRKKGFCAIGSVKTNIGHLDTASGVTGLMKTVLALKHRLIPPSLHFEQPNPQIDFATSPFYVNTVLTEWKAGDTPRRAGVSSFGLGGTNVHMILEEAPILQKHDASRPWQLLDLSARTASALDTLTHNLVRHLEQHPQLNLADVAHTLQMGRKEFNHRKAVVCRDINDAIHALKTADPARIFSSSAQASDCSVAFLFPGVGDHYVHMAWGLYLAEPQFRKDVDHCAEVLKPYLGLDLRDVLYPMNWQNPEKSPAEPAPPPAERFDIRKMLRSTQEPPDPAAQRLNETRLAQPAVFVIEYALARLWMAWIGKPGAMIGYSLGEYVAACIAGVLSLEDALFLIASRAQMIGTLPAGAMLAIPLPESEVCTRLGIHLSLAAVNTSSLCVVSGPVSAIEELEQELAKEDVDCRRLQTSHAFHSKMMTPIVGSFIELFQSIKLKPPVIPYLSNVTGTWITPELALDPAYWAKHMCQEIRLADSVHELFALSSPILLEVGPGQVLSSLVLQTAEAATHAQQIAASSLRYTFDRQPDMAFLLNTLGKLWLAGIAVNWSSFYAREQRLHVPLPTYPFERQHYWIEPQKHTTNLPAVQKSQVKRQNVADWFYLFSWKRSLHLSPLQAAVAQKQCWLVFADEWGIGLQIIKRLEDENQDVVTVSIGSAFSRLSAKKYTLNPHEQTGYDALLKELRATKSVPDMIIHCWSITPASACPDVEFFREAQYAGFYSLVFLAQSLGKYNVTDPLQIRVISDHIHDLEQKDTLDPVKATLLSPCKVIPQEYANITCQCIDIPLPERGSQEECQLLDQIVEELHEPLHDQVIAYRGIHRWVQTFETLPIENSGQPVRLRPQGVYMIVGGLGVIGFYLARWLAQTMQARLIIVGRSELPPKQAWQSWLASHDKQDEISKRIRKVQTLEEMGSDVLVLSADASQITQMQAVVDRTLEHFATINGVIYAAGVESEKNLWSIQGLDYATCELHFRPKVYGSLVLEKVLSTCEIDFCLLFSSLSTVLGGLQFTPYAAANMFLDAYTRYHNQRHRVPWICVDWDGVATPEESVDAIGRILSLKALEHVVVSTGDLYARLDQWVALTSLRQEEQEEQKLDLASFSHYPRPHLQNAYVAPQNELEQSIVETWQAMMGIEQVGIYDNFFMLGGHSLLATQIVTQLRRALQVELPLRTFLETPTIAELATAVAYIQAEQMQSSEQTALPLPLVPVSRNQDLPLSFAQQRLWFIDQFEPGNAAYTILAVLQLNGILNVQALEKSLLGIVQRHEILRTTFHFKADQPVQVIGSVDHMHIPLVDLNSLFPEARNAEIDRLKLRQAQQPFDLARGPLLSAILLRLNEQEHQLSFVFHHIITDGWSNDILFREIGYLYNAHVAGQTTTLPALPIQYADFAVWQRQWLQGERLQTQLDYWTPLLSDSVPLDLPTDHPRPAVQTFHGAHRFFYLPVSLSDALQELSQREGVTLFMTLLTAFQILLARYSGQTDLSVGTSIANRTRSELEGVMGFFINTLVLRSELAGNPTFQQALARTQEVCLGAYAHQDMPFEQLVEVLRPERDLSRSLFFQVMFHLQNTPMSVETWQGLTLSVVPSESAKATFDLTLSITETHRGLHCEIEYNTDLFEADTISRLIKHFQTLLEGIVAAPETALAQLPLLSAAEQGQLLREWNMTQTTEPDESGLLCFPQLFEAQMLRTPEAIAVTFEDLHMTYAELYLRTSHLARRLCALGVGAETLIALLSERDAHLLVALLSVFKAGGTYLPLDALHPVGRLRQVLENSACEVLLTTRSFAATAELIKADTSTRLPLRVCFIEDLLEEMQSEEEMPLPVKPTQLAYVIYTSGSTGQPKGAMIEHKGMLNHLYAKITDLHLTSEDSIAQTASQCFDISIWQCLAALLVGGRVTIFPDAIAHDPEQLLLAIARSHISIYEVVPSMFKFLLDAIERRASGKQPFTELRYLLVTGEALPPLLCQRWFTFQSNVPIVNAYGPTECSDDVTHYFVSQPPIEMATTIPIGRPLANTQLYILDRAFYPVPAGIYGELYVGGIGVGRGYLNDPQRTAEVFLPDPFGKDNGARLYKTGDRTRYLPDGTIEFLGRIDDQVKVRGFRIELGEIEALLSQYSGVQEVAVIARGELSEDKYLVAYLVVSTRIDEAELRTYLKEKLPAYMLPAAFVLLETLPLLPSGKVDRRALLALPSSKFESSVNYQAPHTPLEEMLAEQWKQTLGIEQVGITDNFFEIGGHSLLATRVVAWIGATFQVALPLRTLFEAPTIRELAQSIETLRQSGVVQKLPPLNPVERPEQMPLSFAQQRLWFLNQLEPGSGAYNIPATLKLSGPLSPIALEKSIQQIVQRHESLRTTFVAYQGTPVQVIASNVAIQIPLIDLRGLQPSIREEYAQDLAQQQAAHPFDLTRGPLLRTQLLRLDDEEHVFLFGIHHIISDGWSIGVLVGELTRLYYAAIRDEEVVLPALPVQYADYALWQRAWLQGATLQAQMDYWLQQLAAVPAVLNLPLDRPRPAIQTFVGTQQTVLWPLTLRRELERLSLQEGVTLFMTLLASFQVLLMRYSGQHDIVVGTPVANRQQKELEGLIGFFANTLAMRSDLSHDPIFRDVLKQVREVALQAYTHQDLPFEQLISALPIERSLNYSPLFQVLFVLQNVPQETIALEALVVQRESWEHRTSKFDLTVEVQEVEQGLWVGVEYNTDLFNADTIQHLCLHWHTLLEEIVADPGQRISALQLLSPAEREQILVNWNATQIDYPQGLCLHQLFEAQVQRSPETIALVWEDQQLTYAELDRRANQIAVRLRREGVGPEALVGIYMHRGIEQIVAVLAILKAGGAYVPFDSSYPQQRLTYMLQASQLKVMLTQSTLLEKLPVSDKTTLFCLDTQGQLFQDEPSTTLPQLVGPDNSAYVLYTSGSTGVPKGIVMPHRALVNLMHWMRDRSALGVGSRTLQFSSISFDASCEELFTTWNSGGSLVLINQDVHQDPYLLLQCLWEQGIERLFLPFVALHQMAQVAQQQLERLPKSLREVVTAGEQLQASRPLIEFFQQLGACGLDNQYGPTETHVITAYQLPQNPDDWSPLPPIGMALSNTEVYVLDEHLQLTPPGVAGEFYLGGEALARGYLGRADLTAERFLPHPFSRSGGERLYKTGDLVRYRTDGQVEYLGRMDNQIKLRGFRIELGEIETLLHQYPGVQEAIVLARGDNTEHKYLVAYLVASTEIDEVRLRTYLKEKLPAYMLPAAFVQLETVPLTPSGKADRQALLAYQISKSKANNSYQAPRSSMEEVLVEQWEQILEVERVGITDNFFEIGGHSLLATRAIAWIREAFLVELPLRTLFESPTISDLAIVIVQKQIEQTDSETLAQVLAELEQLSEDDIHNHAGRQ